jgi:hypothetical protein
MSRARAAAISEVSYSESAAEEVAMKIVKGVGTAVVLAVTCGWSGAAPAQFGLYTLPNSDFTWNWGRPENRRGSFTDIDVNGHEAGFDCRLTAELRPGSQLSPTDIREIENELRTRLDFIRAASDMMNALESRLDLDWAQLVCTKRGDSTSSITEEEKLERENKARERMMREVERRRARTRDDESP